MNAHVRFMDGLRGIAILMVFSYHAFIYGILPLTLQAGGLLFVLPHPFIVVGFMGVYLFFFLSGFALFYPYAQHLFESRSLPALSHYIDRRASKILPSYLLALTLLAVFMLLHLRENQTFKSVLAQYMLHVLFIHNFWDSSAHSISPAFWTLGIEVQFYVLFPLIAWFLMRAPCRTVGALGIVAAMYRMALDHTGLAQIPTYLTDLLPTFLDLFGFGSFAAYVIVRERNRKSLLPQEKTFWTILACAAAVLLYVVLSTESVCVGMNCQAWRNDAIGIISIALFVLCVGIAQGTPILRDILENPLLLWFSAISYNLYLWNDILLATYSKNMPNFAQMFPQTNVLHALIAFPAIILFTWMLTRVVERPFLRKSLLSRILQRRANTQ